MKNADLTRVSDGLNVLRMAFDDFRHGGITMTSDSVEALCLRLKELEAESRILENELSRSRWNEAARMEEAERTNIVLREVTRKGGNVALFPVIPRPFGGSAA